MFAAFVLGTGLLHGAAQDNLATVNFNNRVLSDGVSAPVFDETVGGTPAEGGAYCAQLYSGPVGTPENLLVPTGAIVDFRTGLAAGFVNVGADGTRKIPGVAPGAQAVVQIRAWTTAGGATYEAARTNPAPQAKIGRSPPVVVNTQSGVLALPASMVGLQSFSVRHEDLPVPELRRGTQAIFIHWPVDGTTYQVEWSATPDGAGPWQDVTAPVQLVGTNYRALVPFNRPSAFFRLRVR